MAGVGGWFNRGEVAALLHVSKTHVALTDLLVRMFGIHPGRIDPVSPI